VALAGLSMCIPFLPLYLKELGVEGEAALSRWSGVIVGVGLLACGLCTPFWGWLADRHGRKLMLVRAIVGVGLALFVMSRVQTPGQLLLGRVLHGVMGGIVSSTVFLAATSVPRKRLGACLGILESGLIAANVIGPLAGGLLADRLGYRPVFAAGAFMTWGCLLVAVPLVRDTRSPGEGSPGSVTENMRLVLRSPQLLGVATAQLFVMAVVFLIGPVLPLFVEALGAPAGRVATYTGAVLAATAMARFVSSPFWGRRGDLGSHKASLLWCLLGSAALFVPQAMAVSLAQLLAFRVLWGLFSGGVAPTCQTLVSTVTPPARTAGVLSAIAGIYLSGGALAPMIGGQIAAWAGIRVTFVIAGALTLAAWFVVRRKVRDPVELEPVTEVGM